MAGRQQRLAVVLANDAIDQLHEIWRWNAKRYDPDHATRYLAFLKRAIDQLDRNYPKGRPVGTRPEYRYIRIRRRTGGYGHVAVYSVESGRVNVLHVFHEAQDWENKLAEE